MMFLREVINVYILREGALFIQKETSTRFNNEFHEWNSFFFYVYLETCI